MSERRGRGRVTELFDMGLSIFMQRLDEYKSFFYYFKLSDNLCGVYKGIITVVPS